MHTFKEFLLVCEAHILSSFIHFSPTVDPRHFLRETIAEQENYCRNPDGEPKVWCYTTNPGDRWERCDVPLCSGLCCDIRSIRNNSCCSV